MSEKTELEKQMDAFKEKWIGKQVCIIGNEHPWNGHSGTVMSIDHTAIGYGMRIKLDCGEECYVFKGHDLSMSTINSRQLIKK